MKKRVFSIMSLGLIALFLSLLWYERAHSPILDESENNEQMILGLKDPGGEILMIGVEIADEPEERRKGLMGRTALIEHSGMLFIFEEEKPLSFWMKDTLIPLDILFFDAEGRFVSRTSMEPCAGADPCPTYPSEGPARYALEVAAGEQDIKEVGPGWTMVIPQR